MKTLHELQSQKTKLDKNAVEFQKINTCGCIAYTSDAQFTNTKKQSKGCCSDTTISRFLALEGNAFDASLWQSVK